jgi:MoxR-like ATPase
MDIPGARDRLSRLKDNVEEVIKGKGRQVELALIALLSGGQLLIEDVPGVGKTMLARSLALSIEGACKRIQFTPDLLPSDITGVNIYDQRSGAFEFHPGPIFANIVLADEINRATPRTQSSLLEAMDEGQVTVDGMARVLPRPFFVIATQNPVEYHGTYPLPEGQLDRFCLNISLEYPSEPDEVAVVMSQLLHHPIQDLGPVLTTGEIEELQGMVRHVRVDHSLVEYALRIVKKTRSHEELLLGASPRGSIFLLRTAQAQALMQGRDYVVPDDIKELGVAVLAHRILPRSRRQALGDSREIVSRILGEVDVPVGLEEE